MKKEFLLALIFIILMMTGLTYALDCPRGIENDPYPGVCNLYVDSNKDNICDLSQETIPPTVIKTDTNLQFQTRNLREYYVIPIFIGLLLFYLISYFALKDMKILHRKIWNILLLFSFLISAILGIILAINISLGTNIQLPLNMLFWHVEAGIAMTLISIFHILWHLPYFKSIFRKHQ